jgi:hypothetical protein
MTMGKAHTLQRYTQACAGRSIYPIKFNGSIFTVDSQPLGINGPAVTPDWRLREIGAEGEVHQVGNER